MKLQILVFIFIVSFIGCQKKSGTDKSSEQTQTVKASDYTNKDAIKDYLASENASRNTTIGKDTASFIRDKVHSASYSMGDLIKTDVRILDTPTVKFSKGILKIDWSNYMFNYSSDNLHESKLVGVYQSLLNESALVINVLFYETEMLPSIKKLELNSYWTIEKTSDWGDKKLIKQNLLTATFSGKTLSKIKETFDKQKSVRLQKVADNWRFYEGNIQRYISEN